MSMLISLVILCTCPCSHLVAASSAFLVRPSTYARLSALITFLTLIAYCTSLSVSVEASVEILFFSSFDFFRGRLRWSECTLFSFASVQS